MEIALVFQDVEAIGYKLRDKFQTFDESHTLEALKTLARFHASSIIFEEKNTKEFGERYSLNDYFETQLGKAGYESTDPWYLQCMYGALEGLKKFSKYTKEEMKSIEDYWKKVWLEALSLSDPSPVHKNVICHRDLWNNNIMFHYTNGQPDDCILVDFQATRYQPPAGDVMLLLYSNLDPKFREENLDFFLNFYIEELHHILERNDVTPDMITKENFFESAKEQRKWGIVIWACLLPLAWISDEDTSKYFSDTARFDYTVTKNKASFIIEMMESSQDYKEKLIDVFDEIVERYCK